ncbi:MAG: peptidoglycan-binding protein [Clostridia bacterium]|nr:peptidoglycan-binding protein [Clostridia bacterium]
MRKRITLLCLTLVLLLFSGNAFALVRHNCGKKDCICFVQYGDRGQAVKEVIRELYKQGYLKDDTGSVYTREVTAAVRAFQKDHRLKQDGTLTDSTLTWLLWGMNVTSVDRKYPRSDGQEVWIPTDGGTRFHSNPTCSGMAYARKMSARNAQALGFAPCRKCWSFDR